MNGKRKSRRKYTQGERITSLDEFANQELIIVNGKVYSRGWFLSWSFWLARSYLQRGCYKAVSINQAGSDGETDERQNKDRMDGRSVESAEGLLEGF